MSAEPVSGESKQQQQQEQEPQQQQVQQAAPLIDDVESILVSVNDLHPTQPCISRASVGNRQSSLHHLYGKKTKKKFIAFLKEKWCPVIYGPNHPSSASQQKVLYLCDRHHTALALLESKMIDAKDKQLYCKLQGDLSHLSYDAFFQELQQKQWCYLKKLGQAIDAIALPQSIRGLLNDPFRGLAAAAKKNAWMKQSLAPFIEFRWAEYLRQCSEFESVDIENMTFTELCQYETVLIEVCSRPEASYLPGFKGKLSSS